MATTTIKITVSTRERLSRLKTSRRQSYDAVINRILALIPKGDDEGEYTDAFRRTLLEARRDIRECRCQRPDKSESINIR